MDKGFQTRCKRIKFNKRNLPLFCLKFSFLMIFLLLPLFSNSEELNQISLKVQGKGYHQFIKLQDPCKVVINGEDKGAPKSYDSFERDLNDVTMHFCYKVSSCHDMFIDLVDIIEVDLTNFNTENLNDMSSMFNGCLNLKQITFGNINTAGVTNMYRTFFKCTKLISIDLSHFDTSNVIRMEETFSHCESITALDVSKFNTLKVETMYDMFGYCYNLTSIDVSNFVTTNVKDMQGMFYSCYKLKSVDITNFDITKVTRVVSMFGCGYSLTYINMSNKIVRNDQDNTKMYFEHLPDLKVCLIDQTTERLLVPQINYFNFDCSNKCFPKTYKYDLCENICFEYCLLSGCKFDYNDICYYRCPNTTYEPDDQEYFCKDKIEGESYYFNTVREIFKKCHMRCKICHQKGDNTNTKCIECKEPYIFLNESIPATFNNCYEKCTYYYYFDQDETYSCTIAEECPSNYNKLIREKRKCIDQCKNDNFYK